MHGITEKLSRARNWLAPGNPAKPPQDNAVWRRLQRVLCRALVRLAGKWLRAGTGLCRRNRAQQHACLASLVPGQVPQPELHDERQQVLEAHRHLPGGPVELRGLVRVRGRRPHRVREGCRILAAQGYAPREMRHGTQRLQQDGINPPIVLGLDSQQVLHGRHRVAS